MRGGARRLSVIVLHAGRRRLFPPHGVAAALEDSTALGPPRRLRRRRAIVSGYSAQAATMIVACVESTRGPTRRALI